MTRPRFPLLQVRLRTLMITVAIAATLISGVFQAAPILERRSSYLGMAENCDQVAVSYRAKVKQSEVLLAATLAAHAKQPPREAWEVAFPDLLRRSIRGDRRSAEDLEALGRKYRRAASRPWQSIEG